VAALEEERQDEVHEALHRPVVRASRGVRLPGPCAQQAVSGSVALSTFPTPIAVARALQANRVVAEGTVAADGSFSLNIPAGRGYRIEFAAYTIGPDLVFPRSTGGVTA
jgi:hypothetical protein